MRDGKCNVYLFRSVNNKEHISDTDESKSGIASTTCYKL